MLRSQTQGGFDGLAVLDDCKVAVFDRNLGKRITTEDAEYLSAAFGRKQKKGTANQR